MVIKDLFLSTALLNRFIMSPTWIFGFCCICSVDITPSWGYCGVEHRLHGLRMQGERLIWGVVLGEAKLPSVFDFGYVSVLFFLPAPLSLRPPPPPPTWTGMAASHLRAGVSFPSSNPQAAWSWKRASLSQSVCLCLACALWHVLPGGNHHF